MSGSARMMYVFGPLLAVAFFALDLNLELGVAAGVPYIGLVLITLPRGCSRHTSWASATALGLIALGWWLSPEGGEPWKIAANRLLAAGAVVSTAVAIAMKHRGDARYDAEVARHEAVEREHREREALASIGEMASMVAHEVKNPMAGILGALHILAQRLPEDASEHEILERIEDRIKTLVAWIDDLLGYARPPVPHTQAVDCNRLVRDTVTLFGADGGMADVDVRFGEAAEAAVEADPGVVSRALLNLLLNAGQAMEGRGSIRVDVRVVDRRWGEIVVTDEGPGIPPELRSKVLQPFFTTRGRGSGLGLPTVNRAVVSHGGELVLEFPDAGGTVVRMRLPLCDQDDLKRLPPATIRRGARPGASSP